MKSLFWFENENTATTKKVLQQNLTDCTAERINLIQSNKNFNCVCALLKNVNSCYYFSSTSVLNLSNL
jgi:hypothetical protein